MMPCEAQFAYSAVGLNTQPATLTQFGYDGASRLQNVTNGSSRATYSYLANSPLVENIVFRQSGTTRMMTTKSYDYVNRLTSISSSGSALPSPFSYAYAYNSASQRTGVTNADSSYWVYTYDSMGQVTSGRKYFSDGTPVAGQQFDYTFDDIGNRQTTTRDTRQAFYTNNLLNQITGRMVPGYVNVLGTAANSATVTVNNTPTARKADYYRTELGVLNGSAPVWVGVTNVAVLNQGANPDIVASVTGNVFVAKSPEICGYDADGNMTNDGRWVFTWDAENRLKQVESRSDAPSLSRRKVVWEFDGQGRRIRQTTYDGSSGSYVVTEDLKFLSDGWAHVAELNATNNALVRSYVWGLDLSGSQAGAGGVGGLLIVNSVVNGAHLCAYDGNGNVAALVKATDGAESARYEYGPFGEPIRATGAMAKENPFRFSTKRHNDTTDFVLYEYRLYSTSIGRWLSRDPIEEEGGENVLAFIGNGPTVAFDLLGMAESDWPPRNPFPPKYLEKYKAGCCVADTIKKGLAELKKRFGKGRDFLDQHKVKRDGRGGGNGRASCYEGNVRIQRFMGSLPHCWLCFMDRREDRTVGGWDENFIHCFALSCDNSKYEVIFDWFDLGTVNGIYENVADFYKRHPIVPRTLPSPPDLEFSPDCSKPTGRWGENYDNFNDLLPRSNPW